MRLFHAAPDTSLTRHARQGCYDYMKRPSPRPDANLTYLNITTNETDLCANGKPRSVECLERVRSISVFHHRLYSLCANGTMLFLTDRTHHVAIAAMAVAHVATARRTQEEVLRDARAVDVD